MLCQAMELLMHACMAFGQLDYLASCSGCCVDIMIIIQLLRCQLLLMLLIFGCWTGLGWTGLDWAGPSLLFGVERPISTELRFLPLCCVLLSITHY